MLSSTDTLLTHQPIHWSNPQFCQLWMLSRSNWILNWLQDNRLAVFVFYTWSSNSIPPFKSQICCQYRSIFITYLSISAYHIHVHVERVTHEQVCLRQGVQLLPSMRVTLHSSPPPPPCAIPAIFQISFGSISRSLLSLCLLLPYWHLTNFLWLAILRGCVIFFDKRANVLVCVARACGRYEARGWCSPLGQHKDSDNPNVWQAVSLEK